MKQKGFTLIELLVVIAIIGVLASLTLANFTGSQSRARDVQRKNDLKIVRDALEQYKIDNNGLYPVTTLNITDQYTSLSAANEVSANTQFTSLMTTLTASTAKYMSKSVTDPRNTVTFRYRYAANAARDVYILDVCLENAQDPQRYKNNAGTYAFTGPCTATNPNYRVTNP